MKAVLILVVISYAALINCQNTDTTPSKLPDPIVGTWKSIEITYNGEKYDEIGCSTFTPGGFWSCQLHRPNLLNLTTAPETLEEYESVLKSHSAFWGSYAIKGDSCNCYKTYDLKPQNIGDIVRGKYHVTNDTLIFDVGKWRYTWIRQE
jgi:hypothetical protein